MIAAGIKCDRLCITHSFVLGNLREYRNKYSAAESVDVAYLQPLLLNVPGKNYRIR